MKRKCTFPLQLWSFLRWNVKPQTSLCMLQYKTCVKEINSGRKTENVIIVSKHGDWTIAFYLYLDIAENLLLFYWVDVFRPASVSANPGLKSGLIFLNMWQSKRENWICCVTWMIWVKEKGEALAVVLLCWELLYRIASMRLFAPSVEQSLHWPSRTVAEMYTEHNV